MTINHSKRWLLTYLTRNDPTLETQRSELITPLKQYFNQQNPHLIQQLLLSHGLFQPEHTSLDAIESWMKKDHWQLIERLYSRLKKAWQGPDIDIFIFPADFNNDELISEFHGVSGLCFKDKIFLFITDQTTEEKIHAIFAHEYSHAVRLNDLHRNEDALTLKDTIVLEGIAEVITEEMFGIRLLPNTDHQPQEIKKLLSQWIEPHQNIRTTHPLHHQIMYGSATIPKRAGYLVGLFIVKQWRIKHPCSLFKLLSTPTNAFFGD